MKAKNGEAMGPLCRSANEVIVGNNGKSYESLTKDFSDE